MLIEVKNNMGKIYIAGKISGLDLVEAFWKFSNTDLNLTALGYDVINPMKINVIDNKKEWYDYMVADISLLFKCDAIYLQKDWGQSKGARIEYQIAKEMEMKIIFEQ